MDDWKMNNLYFDIQAKVGISKHIYGLIGTKELCRFCEVDASKSVLVVGSGNGASACKIAKLYESRVVGADIHPEMVKAAQKFSQKKNPGAEFLVGDALNLPFKMNSFDAVISESVTAFVGDKSKAIQEYKRVAKDGGYIGLGEVTWLQKPTQAAIDFSHDIMGGLDPESKLGWENLLTDNGLEIIISKAEELKKLKQTLGEFQMMSPADLVGVYSKFLVGYVSDASYRSAVHRFTRAFMKRPRGYMARFGAGLYVARK